MKALVVEAPETVAVREIAETPLESGLIRIKIEYCLICTWEKRIYTGRGGALPFVPGHEASGIIAEVPSGMVTSFKVGDHVVFKTLDHCGHCSHCYAGETNLCTGTPRKRYYDGIPGSGGMAQYIDLEPGRIYKISEDLPLRLAAFAEPLACCYHSVVRGNLKMGDFVGISGGGFMGQLHAVLARMRGAKVLLIEPDPEKAAHARAAGAHATVDPFSEDLESRIAEFTGGEKLDAYFITTPQPTIAEAAVKIVRDSGRIIYYGSFSPNEPIGLDLNKIHYSQIEITGSFSATSEDFFRAARLLSQGLVDPEPFLSALYSLDRATDAFTASLDIGTYRVGIRIADGPEPGLG